MIAAATPIRTETPLANTGSGRISAGNGQRPATPQSQPATAGDIDFYQCKHVRRKRSRDRKSKRNSIHSRGVPISYNGWTVQITGSPNAGDTFSVGPEYERRG